MFTGKRDQMGDLFGRLALSTTHFYDVRFLPQSVVPDEKIKSFASTLCASRRHQAILRSSPAAPVTGWRR